MNEKIKGALAAMAAVAALAVGGAAIAGAAGGGEKSSPQATATAVEPQSIEPAENESDRNDSEAPIGGSALDKASAAALEETGGGQVSETEVGDEESYYEVEVTLDDGSQVDVQLDRGFAVVGAETDGHEDDPGEK